jgi:hypothetical protein
MQTRTMALFQPEVVLYSMSVWEREVNVLWPLLKLVKAFLFFFRTPSLLGESPGFHGKECQSVGLDENEKNTRYGFRSAS